MKRLLLAAFLLAVPSTASAAVYDLYLGGMCSTCWTEGKGAGVYGSWSGETAIDVRISQTDSIAAAAARLKPYLDTYCANGNTCYIYNYSGGDAALGYLFDTTDTDWSIGYVVTTGGAGGGSKLAGDVASVLTCSYANELTESGVRGKYDHNDVGEMIYRLGGHKNMWESTAACVAGSVLSVLSFGLVSNHCMTGKHDGAVAYHSSGAYSSAGDYGDFWNSGSHYGSGWHAPFWQASTSYDEGDNLNHYEIKSFGICLDGGLASSGISGFSACMSWADGTH